MNNSDKVPSYPITVSYVDDVGAIDEIIVYENEDQLVTSLEFFDSADPDEKAVIEDAFSRRVELVIFEMELKVFRIRN